jgi:hypothetical protein
VLGRGTNRLFGVAWAGEHAIARVEVSTDGGATWSEADLVGPSAAYSWTLWEYLWEVSQPGPYSLLARAVSAGGQVQPSSHEQLNGGYEIHFSRPVQVEVELARHGQAHRGDPDTLVYDMNAFAEENTRRPLDIEMAFVGGDGI